MKRRNFILLSLYSGAAISLPSFGCSTGNSVAYKPWMQPDLLSHICDAKTLKEIGAAYMQKFSAKNNEKQLMDSVLTESDNKILPASSEDAVIHSLLEQKIQRDFEIGKTVVVKGWILSETEAQQCALFSLTQN
ncbi:MAG TPA: hypothetical protein VGI82_03150 [Chitinophagaceae bacterium]|jgi:hypothetical protein